MQPTALFAAIAAADHDAVAAALRAGADARSGRDYEVAVDRCLRTGIETPLQRAVAVGDAAIVTLLLQAGADVDAVDPASGRTALLAAVEAGDVSIARLLADHGKGRRVEASQRSAAVVRATEQALQVACLRGEPELVLCCERAGANVDPAALLPDAARGGHPAMLAWLAQRGRFEGGLATALHEAAHQGHAAAVRWLLDHGAPIASKNSFAWTALHLAAYGGHLPVVELLLAAGADPQLPCGQQRTAASWAEEAGQDAVVARLQQRSA
ncbi:MAG: ankyrin repeat domain-containing protein [Planctomycetes bacterium]|jgi:ankyrin repeat protein|nr:ankyrin repeat domain-containing protein [Planctomycetota bacterium]